MEEGGAKTWGMEATLQINTRGLRVWGLCKVYAGQGGQNQGYDATLLENTTRSLD
jgi:hypothetical protein